MSSAAPARRTPSRAFANGLFGSCPNRIERSRNTRRDFSRVRGVCRRTPWPAGGTRGLPFAGSQHSSYRGSGLFARLSCPCRFAGKTRAARPTDNAALHLMKRPRLLLLVVSLAISSPVFAASVFTTRPDDPAAVYVTPQDFGVRGDGATDDAGGIQAAVDKAAASFGGGIVFLPSGRYRVTRTICVWSGVRSRVRRPGPPDSVHPHAPDALFDRRGRLSAEQIACRGRDATSHSLPKLTPGVLAAYAAASPTRCPNTSADACVLRTLLSSSSPVAGVRFAPSPANFGHSGVDTSCESSSLHLHSSKFLRAGTEAPSCSLPTLPASSTFADTV